MFYTTKGYIIRPIQYYLILLSFTISAFGFDYHLEPYSLTKNVDCFFGLNDKAKESNGGRVINTCYIKSDKGYVVIDSGPTYAYAQQAYTAMQKREKLPVKYVINTSSQELHILGNEFYKEHGATLIGPKSYEKLIEEQKPLSMLEKLSNVIFTNTRLVPLDVYQDENTTITIGDTKVEIKKLEKGESKNLVVYLPKEETIFAGNYISNKRVPSLKEHNSLNEWMENLKTIEGLSWKHIISAHGVKRNREALNYTKNYLNKIKETILTSLKTSSKTSLKSIENKTFGTYEHIAFFKDFHSENIQKAYDELKTTKLKTDKLIANDEDKILTAMLDIKTNKVLKEGTYKTILVPEKIVIKKEKEPKTEVVKKKIKENVKIAKVEITDEISVQSIIEEASKTEVAPTTEENVPSISYDKDFYTAQQHAIKEHKMIFIKVEADNCEPCQELDQKLASNKTLRKMINKYTKAIKVNTSYESVPLGLTNMGTPTVFVINPETESVLVKLEGMDEIEELEASLRSFTKESDASALAFNQ
jgi:glyoxylase-like metal-dependent hydrolase (beta-lactamase superfamily II)